MWKRSLGWLGWALALVSGCTSGGGGGAADAVVHYYQFSLPGFQEVFTGLARKFHDTHPEFRVKIHTLPPSTDDQHQFYVTHLSTGGEGRIDVFALDVIWAAEFARAGLLMPVDPLFSEAEWSRFFPSIARAAVYSGRRLAAPYFIDAGVLYSRADLLRRHGYRRPPDTWRELAAMAQKVMQAERDDALAGFVWQGRQYEGLVCNFVEHLPSPLEFKEEGGRLQLRPSSSDLMAAMVFMRDLVSRHGVSPEAVFAMAEEEARQTFQNGGAVFMRNWPYAWKLMQEAGSKVAGRVWVSALPGQGPRKPGHGALGGFLLGIHRDTPQPRAARAWVRFLTGEAAQETLKQSFGLTPARRDVAARGKAVAGLPADTLLRVMDAAVPRPVTPLYVPMSQALQASLSGALTGVHTPQEAVRLLESELKRLFRILS